MGTDKFDIHVYAHWQGMDEVQKIGVVSAHFAKGRKSFSFEYENNRLKFILYFSRYKH